MSQSAILVLVLVVMEQGLRGFAQLEDNSTDNRTFCDPNTGDCEIVGPEVEYVLDIGEPQVEQQQQQQQQQQIDECPDVRPPGLFDCPFHAQRGLCNDLPSNYCQKSCKKCAIQTTAEVPAHENGLASITIFVALIAVVAVFFYSRNKHVQSGVFFWIGYLILPFFAILLAILTFVQLNVLKQHMVIFSVILLIISSVIYVFAFVLLVMTIMQFGSKKQNFFEFQVVFLILVYLVLSLLGIVLSIFGFIE